MSLFPNPVQPFTGSEFLVVDAQRQARTPRDVLGPWVHPGRVPSKLAGRKGTRRTWKRAHPPHRVWLYREPTDVLQIGRHRFIVTPRQFRALKEATNVRQQRDCGSQNLQGP